MLGPAGGKGAAAGMVGVEAGDDDEGSCEYEVEDDDIEGDYDDVEDRAESRAA